MFAGKLPDLWLPQAVFNRQTAESSVRFTSVKLPMPGFTSHKSMAAKRPVSYSVSIIVVPSRTVNPPATVSLRKYVD